MQIRLYRALLLIFSLLYSLLPNVSAEETVETTELHSLDNAYRQNAYAYVVRRSEAFIKTHPNSPLIDQIVNLKALSYIGLKQYSKAISEFKKITLTAHNAFLQASATYNLAYIYFELGQRLQALYLLNEIQVSSLDKASHVKFYILRAQLERLEQQYAESAQDILLAIEKTPPEPIDQMVSFLEETLNSLDNIIVIEHLCAEFEALPIIDRLFYKAGTYYFNQGEVEKSKKYFEKIIQNFPESPYFAASHEYLQKLQLHDVVDPTKIGILLTLSGKFGSFGYRALQGIELALNIFQPKSTAENETKKISLIIMDDKGEVDSAISAMETLFYKFHVMAIIGPVSSKLAGAVGKKAQELGVPLIALTQKEVKGGDYVFNAGLTPSMQVHELVQYATEKAKIKNFAILFPASHFGEEYAKTFWEELDSKQATVVGYESYPEDETDFRFYIDKLVGLAQKDARSNEVAELKALRESTPGKKIPKKMEHFFDLKPIVDFQAVFIPDEPKVLGQILPTFAYRDVENILFLGINTWDNQELVARAGPFAEGAIFTDGFYADSEKLSLKKFVDAYNKIFNMTPALLEALAYDAAHIISSLLHTEVAPASREQLKNAISSLKEFSGITGKISYQSGKLSKYLHRLTIKKGKIEEID